jgi:hypothetical protein
MKASKNNIWKSTFTIDFTFDALAYLFAFDAFDTDWVIIEQRFFIVFHGRGFSAK